MMYPSEVEWFRADLKKELTDLAEGFLAVALRMVGSKSTKDIYDIATQRLEEASDHTIQKKIGEAVDAIFSDLKTRGMLVDGEKAPDARRERELERIRAAEKDGIAYDTFLG